MDSTRLSRCRAQFSEEEFAEDSLLGLVLLPSKCLLDKLLAKSPKDKFYIVLTVPNFPNWACGMRNTIGNYDGTTASSKILASLIGECQSNQVMEKIHEMNEHAKRNQISFKNPVDYAVDPGETDSKEFSCFYSIYKGGQLFKTNLNRLPIPPTTLSVQQNKSTLSLNLEFVFENPGFPFSVLIMYRPKSDCCDAHPWKFQKTADISKTTIYFEPGSPIEFLVAMDSCIGRSDFVSLETERLPCSVTDTPITIQPKQNSVVEWTGPPQPVKTTQKASTSLVPPTYLQVESVTHCTAELLWSPSKGRDCRVRYWKYKKESSAQSLNVIGSSIGCRLEKLQAGTTYCVNIWAVSDDGQKTSLPSETVQFTTAKTKVTRFAEKMRGRCEKIKSENGLDLYAVPLTKTTDGMAEHFSFGEVGQSKKRKTIMLIDATDTAVKSRLINGMVNYIFDVDWLDNFRFQLVDQESDDATDVPVRIYHIHHMEGFRIPYSLTIIVTPDHFDTNHPNENSDASPFVLFREKDVVYDLDLAIFVADAPVPRPPSQFYMFDSIMAVYEGKLKNIGSGSNFNDEALPLKGALVTGTPVRHKLDSSAFFCWNQKTVKSIETDGGNNYRRHHFLCYYREYKLNRFMWSMDVKNFERIFSL